MSTQAAQPGQGAAARAVFNAMHRSRPDVIASCATTADVVDAISFAREHGLPVAVRGGGHSVAGLSSIDGGVLIDLAAMNGVQVDPERGSPRAGRRAWGDVDHEAQAFGSLRRVASCRIPASRGSRSAAGTAGCGASTGSPATASSRRRSCARTAGRTASAHTNPDLYWAIRGGGGNFGVVTASRSAPPARADGRLRGHLLPARGTAGVLRGWREYAERAKRGHLGVRDDHLPRRPGDARGGPRPARDHLGGVYAGDPEEGMRIQPLRELGTPLFDCPGPMPFVGVQTGFDPLFPRGVLRAYWKTQYLDELTDEAIDMIAARARPTVAAHARQHVPHGRGDRAVGAEDTAFATRSAPYMVSIDGMWADPGDDEENVAWVRSAWEAVREFGTGDVYLNFTGLADEGERRRGHRLRSQPGAPGTGEGDVRPGQLLPPEQQHRAGGALAAARSGCRARTGAS